VANIDIGLAMYPEGYDRISQFQVVRFYWIIGLA